MGRDRVDDDAQFAALCEVIGRAELAGDSRFATQEARHANRRLLDDPIAAWTSTLDHYEAMRLLQAVGVPAGAALDAGELLRDEHLLARNGFEYVETPGAGPTPYPRPAFRLSGTPVPLEMPAPAFAGANREVFEGLLGMSEAEIAALVASGVTSDEPVAPGH